MLVVVGMTSAPAVAGTELYLKAGLNLVSFTKVPDPPLTSWSLGDLLGPSLLAVSRLDVPQQVLQTTSFRGAVSGAKFPVRTDEAYYVEMAADAVVDLTGTDAQVTVDLGPGINLVGFNPVPPHYRAFHLLRGIGESDVVTSARRLDRESGRYQTAVQTIDNLSGDDFPIRPGEGHRVSMLQAVNDVAVPLVYFPRASEHFLTFARSPRAVAAPAKAPAFGSTR